MLLRRHGDADASDEWTTLHVRSFPFLVGDSPDDVDWECECGAKLATRIYARQVLDLLIRCGSCTTLLESPRRAAGEPIAGQPVYFRPGLTYMINGVVNIVQKPVMMVGHSAFMGYTLETGRLVPGFVDVPSPALTNLDAESFERMAGQLSRLLGDDFTKLRETDARGKLSRTPPPARNRVIELVEFAETAARDLQAVEKGWLLSLNGDLLAESGIVLEMAARWANHPAWPKLSRTLASAEAPHTVMLLTAAAYLVDANIGVGIHFNQVESAGSTADIWIEPDLSQRVDVEVKTPLAFRGPKQPITPPRAVAILGHALKRSSKQRGNTRSSLLIVGGFHMRDSFDVVASTARAMLALERRKWRGLAGILVIDCTYEQSRNGQGQVQFAPTARVELARHPGYAGGLTIEQEAPATAPFKLGDEPS